MFVQKVPHIKDQFLTQERASMELESGQIAVGWYTNEQDSQSVVHSHPYYELVLPLVGSNVRYSVDGNIYDINLGEMIIFPARCYHAGMFNITDKISERLIAQINAELWQEALLASGLVAPTWLGQLVILDADAVTAWDLRGLFERMAQTAYLHGSTQHMVQRCELVELLLLNAIWGAYLFGVLYWLYQFLPSLLGITVASYMTDLIQMLPYVVTIVVLIVVSLRKKKENQPPEHLGLSYFREER